MPKRSAVLPPRSNPFVHARALAPQEGIDRGPEPASRRLLELAAGGHNAVLYAPRRFGKTTLIRQLLQAATERDMPGVLIDLSDVLSVADVATRLELAYRTLPGHLRRLVNRELGTVAVSSPIVGVTVGRRSQEPDPIAAVHTLLELPAQIVARHGQRVLVVLDEFQSLTALAGMDGVFRSHLQHHSDVSYLFCGSEPSLLRALFEDRARPLYAQAELVRLDRLDRDAARDFVEHEFTASGKDAGETAGDLVFVSEGHPQRLMLLAHLLWDRVAERTGASPADLRAAYSLALWRVDPELRSLWDRLSANERRVLAAVASGLSPYQREAQDLMGLANRSSAARAVETLEGKAILERAPDNGLRIVDPLLAPWVRRRGGARLEVHVLPHAGQYVVTDGPSLALVRSAHPTLEEAQAEADRIAAGGRGGDIFVYDSADPNDLPEWAFPSRGLS